MAQETILQKTENNNPSLTSSYVLISDNSNPLDPKSYKISLRDLRGDGYGYWGDSTYTSGSPLVVNNSRVQLTIDGLASNTETSYLPKGVTTFWNTSTNKIVPENVGDGFIGRLDFKAVPSGTDVYFDIQIDIGDGSVIDIFNDVELFPKGTGVEQKFSIPLPFFSLSTFVSNGGKIYVDTTVGSKNMSVYDIGILVHRTFAAN